MDIELDFSDFESAIAVLKTVGAFSGCEWVLRTNDGKLQSFPS